MPGIPMRIIGRWVRFVVVTEKFEGCRVKPFGFVDDEQLHECGDSVH